MITLFSAKVSKLKKAINDVKSLSSKRSRLASTALLYSDGKTLKVFCTNDKGCIAGSVVNGAKVFEPFRLSFVLANLYNALKSVPSKDIDLVNNGGHIIIKSEDNHYPIDDKYYYINIDDLIKNDNSTSLLSVGRKQFMSEWSVLSKHTLVKPDNDRPSFCHVNWMIAPWYLQGYATNRHVLVKSSILCEAKDSSIGVEFFLHSSLIKVLKRDKKSSRIFINVKNGTVYIKTLTMSISYDMKGDPINISNCEQLIRDTKSYTNFMSFSADYIKSIFNDPNTDNNAHTLITKPLQSKVIVLCESKDKDSGRPSLYRKTSIVSCKTMGNMPPWITLNGEYLAMLTDLFPNGKINMRAFAVNVLVGFDCTESRRSCVIMPIFTSKAYFQSLMTSEEINFISPFL